MRRLAVTFLLRSRVALCEFGGFAAMAAAAGLVWTPAALVVVAAYLFNLAYSPRSKGGS